jgi:signal transduction histidine kinase
LLDGDAGKLSKKQAEYVSDIIKSANNINRVLADFLDATRINTGKFELRKEDMNLSNIVDNEVKALKEMAADYNRELVYVRSKEDIMITGDASRLRQVVTNLIDNAIFYSSKKIEVNLQKYGNRVVFTVKDDGIGVPEAEQSKIFTKMYRASNAGVTRPDGTGIGLYVVKKIVEGSGGKIIFKSVEGKGSFFGFELSQPD